jgi:hypothetical protein
MRQVAIRNLGHLARIFRKRRYVLHFASSASQSPPLIRARARVYIRTEDGALTLASMEVKFVVDKNTQQPTELTMYQLKEANSVCSLLLSVATVQTQPTHLLFSWSKSLCFWPTFMWPNAFSSISRTLRCSADTQCPLVPAPSSSRSLLRLEIATHVLLCVFCGEQRKCWSLSCGCVPVHLFLCLRSRSPALVHPFPFTTLCC